MSTIGGKRKENTENSDYSKRVGLFEARVIAINPTENIIPNIMIPNISLLLFFLYYILISIKVYLNDCIYEIPRRTSEF